MALRQREVFAKRIPLYRKDPCLFFKEVTGFKPDPWQKEAATAIAQHRKVSIRSGQGVGKTAFEANLVLWFLSCFPYPRVVCTAPTRQQLNDVLWAEIAKWQERSPVLQATEDEDDTSDDSSNQLNHDSAASIAAQVSQRVELCRLGDKLHLDGMESMPVMQAKKKVVHAVIPGMRLDGKSKAYINAAFDIAKGKINGRKTVADQRRQVFNADSANAAVRNVGKKNNPDEARDRMIQRHAGEKED